MPGIAAPFHLRRRGSLSDFYRSGRPCRIAVAAPGGVRHSGGSDSARGIGVEPVSLTMDAAVTWPVARDNNCRGVKAMVVDVPRGRRGLL